jgi:hypothetical protein
VQSSLEGVCDTIRHGPRHIGRLGAELGTARKGRKGSRRQVFCSVCVTGGADRDVVNHQT